MHPCSNIFLSVSIQNAIIVSCNIKNESVCSMFTFAFFFLRVSLPIMPFLLKSYKYDMSNIVYGKFYLQFPELFLYREDGMVKNRLF